MRAFIRYRRFMIAVLLGTLAAAVFLTTWVNPWRVTPAPWTSSTFENYRGIDPNSNRTAKAGLAHSGKWDAAIFGSSRVDIGFDPRDSAFGNLNVVNLGLNAGNLDENEAIFRYFMETQSPSLVIFLVDAGDLTKPIPSANATDFATSPLVENARPLERSLRYHTGISALSASIQTLSRRIRGQVSDHTPQGFRREATRLANPRAQIASLYLATTWRLAQERVRFNALNERKLEMIRSIIRTCREKNTRLVFVFPPNHASFQQAFVEVKDNDPYFARDRRAMVEIVESAKAEYPNGPAIELWDFQNAHPLNSPPLPLEQGAQMPGWVDLFHFTPEIGSLILRRIQGAPGDYGVPLHSENLEQYLRDVRTGLEAWCGKEPRDLEFIREALNKFGPLTTEGKF